MAVCSLPRCTPLRPKPRRLRFLAGLAASLEVTPVVIDDTLTEPDEADALRDPREPAERDVPARPWSVRCRGVDAADARAPDRVPWRVVGREAVDRRRAAG